MAGRAARLFIEIGADVRGAARGIDSVNRQLKDLGRQASSVRNIAIAATAVVAVRKAAGVLHELSQESANEVAAQARLQKAIANTGRVIDRELVGSLDAWIAAQQDATGFNDSEIRDALTTAVNLTGDYAKAQEVFADAVDLSRGAKIDLVDASRLLGRVDEESIGRLGQLIPGLEKLAKVEVAAFDERAAAAQLAERANVDFEAALAAVKKGGSGLDSVLLKHGIATKKMAEDAAKGADSYIDVASVFSEVRKRFGGQGAEFMLGPAGDARRTANEVSDLREEIGSFVGPLFSRGTRLALGLVRGLRRAFSLFTTDISGPRLGTARKMWKAAFGEEMPGALGTIVDFFGKIGERIQAFVDDLNSADPNKVRGAIKAFADGLKNDAADAVKGFNAELDKLGVTGLIVKVGLGAILFEKATGFGASALSDIVQLLLTIPQSAYFTVALGRALGLTTPVGILVGMGVLASVVVFKVVSDIAGGDQTIADKVTQIGKLAFAVLGGALIGFGAVAGFPIAAAIGIGLVFSVVGLHFIDKVGAAGFETMKTNLWNLIKAGLPFGAGLGIGVVEMTIPLIIKWAIGGDANPGSGYVAPPTIPGTGGYSVVTDVRSAIGTDTTVRVGGAVPSGYEYWYGAGGAAVFRNAQTGDIIKRAIIGESGGGGPVIEAARGFSGIVDRPTMFLAGEKFRPESVDISPLGGGRRGGEVVVNLSIGSVDSGERVRELETVLARQLRLYATG